MATQEQINDHKGWLMRQRYASLRVDSGKYNYTDPQGEDDGISLASIDDEIAQRAHEIGLTVDENSTLESEADRAIEEVIKKQSKFVKVQAGHYVSRDKRFKVTRKKFTSIWWLIEDRKGRMPGALCEVDTFAEAQENIAAYLADEAPDCILCGKEGMTSPDLILMATNTSQTEFTAVKRHLCCHCFHQGFKEEQTVSGTDHKSYLGFAD